MPKPDLTDLAGLQGKLPPWLHVSDLQGFAQLTTQGVLGAAGLAEKVHGNVYKAVAAAFPMGSKFVDATPGGTGIRRMGITGLVYGGVRGITRLAGGTVNSALRRAATLLPRTSASSPAREAMLSALNGVLGDRLLDTANPLAITMGLRHDGRPLVPAKAELAARLPKATGKIVLLVHGLCMNDLQWGETHASTLAALGYTPIYLHYNSGLHTWANGAQLAALLQQLALAWPQPLEELSIVAHSMGGLVARSACAIATTADYGWRGKLRNIVFLGTPHHGAPLERVGNWVDVLLGSNLVTRPFAKLGQLRSSGITDLRYGHVLPPAEDAGRFEGAPDTREPLPLPAGVNCFAIAATTSSQPGGLKDRLLGDGLVPVDSALGRHVDAAHQLAFSPENQWVAPAMNHMQLLTSPEVSARLLRWLA